MELRVLHKALEAVGGAELLLVDQAKYLARHGAAVRLRTLRYDEARWRERTGTLAVDALYRGAPDERAARLRRALNEAQIEWLLADLARADLALVHGYPISSALGAVANPAARLWYCHEAPRWLHPAQANPYLAANLARAPERDAPRYYRRSLASPVGALPMVGRRRPSRVEADIQGTRGLTAIWANSEYTRDSVRRIYRGVEAEVVYPFVQFPSETPPRRARSAEGLRVLTVTRLEWIKNLDTLLAGFAVYKKRRDARARLEIVGTGDAGEALVRLARELDIADAVRFHGFVSDAALDQLAKDCDVFACLPIDEPFGMIFPEAIGRGLLVLGPDHGGPVEILEGGQFGELADPLDAEAIADGLSRLASLSEAEAEARRSAAARACRSRFSEDAVGKRMLSLLQKLGFTLPL